MSIDTQTLLEEERSFRKPKSYVMGSLGFVTTLFVIIAAVGGVIINLMFGIWPTLAFILVVGLLLILMLNKDHHDRSLIEKGATRAQWWRILRSGENLYRSGALTRYGTARLPGLLAKSEMYEFTDNLNEPFALLHFPSTNHYSVTFEAQPDGSSLHDQIDLDANVKRWYEWLEATAYEQNLVQVQVTVQTSPSSGPGLRREVTSKKVDWAPPLAVDVMDDILDIYPGGSATISSWVTLTFSGIKAKGSRKVPEMAKVLATRIPALAQKLSQTGAGICVPLNVQELSLAVRMAYDPAVADVVAESESRGIPRSQMVSLWDSAGPIAHDTQWDHYQHDSGVSVTWVKTGVRGDVNSKTLNPLLEAHPDIPIKRVAIIYTPHSPGASARVAESDRKNAQSRVRSSKNGVPSAKSTRELVATSQVAHDEAKGHAVVDFAILITATVRDTKQDDGKIRTALDQLPEAHTAVDQITPTARIQHRLVYGSQDTAFTQGLPVGVISALHASVPATIREGL